MDLNLNVYFHLPSDPRLAEAIARVEAALAVVINQGIIMTQQMDDLEVEVSNNTTVEQSAVTLLNGLAATVLSLKNDPVKLQAFVDSLKASSTDLAAAVAANTPAAPVA